MSRLSEVLERIRPAGAPGASAEGAGRREQDRFEHDTAAIAAVLAEFEAEADLVIEAARREAAEIREQAERRVQQITSGLPDQIAVALAAAKEQHLAGADEELARARDESLSKVERLRTQAAEGTDRVIDAVVTTIWSILPPTPPEEDRS